MIVIFNLMPVCEEQIYWSKVIDAHERLDMKSLERLQYEHPEEIHVYAEIQFFILSVIERQEQEKLEVPVLSSMNQVKKSSFFKRITTSE